jgi:hypothetical protein
MEVRFGTSSPTGPKVKSTVAGEEALMLLSGETATARPLALNSSKPIPGSSPRATSIHPPPIMRDTHNPLQKNLKSFQFI